MLKGTYQTQQLRLYVICFSVLLPSCFIDGPKIVEDAGEANKSPNEVDSEIDSKGESDCEADGDTDTETNSYTDTTFDSNSEESCTGCLIDAVCFSNGMVNPDNSCLICAIKSSKTSWSYNNGIACNDGLFCTENDKCVDGICSVMKSSINASMEHLSAMLTNSVMLRTIRACPVVMGVLSTGAAMKTERYSPAILV